MRVRAPLARRAVILLALISIGSACRLEPDPLPRGTAPSLAVLLVIDQTRYDYLERFRPYFSGGLARLLEQGLVFSDAHQNHAGTTTAPGHAALATGMEPARSGIIANTWFDRETRASNYSAGPGGSQSPVNLRVTALGDWVKTRDSRSRVFAASGKDRAAVMMGGQRPDGAFWYDRSTGGFTTTDYYASAPPAWLTEFNNRRLADGYYGQAWDALLRREERPAGEIVELDTGVIRGGFPHTIGGYSPVPGPSYYSALYDSPLLDELLLEFAKLLIEREQLGLDGSVDILALSFSALDTVGHDYGPHSPEILDVLVRLDAHLESLFGFIDEHVGLDHTIFGVSSDHGVVPLPETREMAGLTGRRLAGEDIRCVQRAGRRLSEQIGVGDWFLDGFYLDETLLVERGLQVDDVERRLATILEACPAVRKAWTATELASEEWTDDPIAQRFRDSFIVGLSPNVTVQAEPFMLLGSGLSTTHGSVYDYDTRVPIILMGPGIPSGRVAARVATVDVAPTLAGLIGVEVPEGLDGTPLQRHFPPTSAPSTGATSGAR